MIRRVGAVLAPGRTATRICSARRAGRVAPASRVAPSTAAYLLFRKTPRGPIRAWLGGAAHADLAPGHAIGTRWAEPRAFRRWQRMVRFGAGPHQRPCRHGGRARRSARLTLSLGGGVAFYATCAFQTWANRSLLRACRPARFYTVVRGRSGRSSGHPTSSKSGVAIGADLAKSLVRQVCKLKQSISWLWSVWIGLGLGCRCRSLCFGSTAKRDIGVP